MNKKIILAVVKASAKNNLVEFKNDKYLVSVKAKPLEGQANLAVIKILAEYFKTPQKNIQIISGHKSKNKRIAVYL